jgi:hypothetical protein
VLLLPLIIAGLVVPWIILASTQCSTIQDERADNDQLIERVGLLEAADEHRMRAVVARDDVITGCLELQSALTESLPLLEYAQGIRPETLQAMRDVSATLKAASGHPRRRFGIGGGE